MYKDKQAVFNQITDHLARQKVRALAYPRGTYGGGCMLRTESGLKCAVGCLIPDSEYLEVFEEDSAVFHDGSKGVFGRWLKTSVDESLFPLLCDVQTIHDEGGTPEADWPDSLTGLALQEGLTFDPADFTRKLLDPAYVHAAAVA